MIIIERIDADSIAALKAGNKDLRRVLVFLSAEAKKIGKDDGNRQSTNEEVVRVLRKQIAKFTTSEVHLNIVEVRKPETDATLIASSIAQQLERRVAFRRAMKRSVQSAMRLGAEGIRINAGGRLGGAEIARLEWYREGRVPLHTLRADIDYGIATAHTAYGTNGLKVWVFKGEILEHDPLASERRALEGGNDGERSGGDRRRERDPRGDREGRGRGRRDRDADGAR